MPRDKENLIAAIARHKEDVIDTVCKRLQKLPSSHYEMIDYERHLEREESFLNALLQGFRDEESFLTFVERLSEHRFDEGYSLDEFQDAFNVVEDTVWDMLETNFPHDESLVGMLAIVSKLFRASKDRLARVFLQEAFSAQRELEHLQKKFRAYRRMTRKGLP